MSRGSYRGIFAIFRLHFSGGMQYRAAAAAGIVTQFVWGFMEILLFSAFYRADPSAFPMEFSAFVAYTWLQQATLSLMMTWFMDQDIFESIASGRVAYELCRPLPLFRLWYWQDAAKRLSKAVLRCFPILIIAAFLPPPFRLVFSGPPLRFLAFFLSLLLAFFIVVAFDMLVYAGTMFTMTPLGLRIISASVAELLSGALLPLPFLPDGFRGAVELLPFASMQNAPFRIFSGDISSQAVLGCILLQCFWLGVLLLIGKGMMHKALCRVTIQGG